MLDMVRARREDVYAIARKHKIGKVYVFGSCARKEETPVRCGNLPCPEFDICR